MKSTAMIGTASKSTLDPEEEAVAEGGGMMFMADGIEMEMVFGDGSASQHEDGGIEFVSTHPMSGERAAYLKMEIERAGSWPGQPLDVAWQEYVRRSPRSAGGCSRRRRA